MKTIMIVDEQPDIHQQLSSYIEENDFTIKTVNNSRKALEELSKNKDVSLLLLHTSLPDDEKTGYFPIIPTSKLTKDSTDVNNFLIKPFTKNQFCDFIKNKLKNHE
jgi:DNA-binding NtrC family response regulator